MHVRFYLVLGLLGSCLTSATDFKKDKDTMPVIKVMIFPIYGILRSGDLRTTCHPVPSYPGGSLQSYGCNHQDDLMVDLEKSFNNHIEQAKSDISKQLDELLKIFNDKSTMKKVINASKTASKNYSFLQTPLEDSNEPLEELVDTGQHDQLADADLQEPSVNLEDLTLYRGSPDTVPISPPDFDRVPDPIPPSSSYDAALETDQSKPSFQSSAQQELVDLAAASEDVIIDGPVSFLETGFVDGLKQKLSNVGSPALLVQLMDVYIPDSSLESQISKILKARDKSVKQMFATAKDMFDEVSTITKAEIKTNLNIQLNSFTADLDSIRSLLGGAKSSFLETNSTEEMIGMPTAENLLPLSFLGIEAQQLNVAVGTPDVPYPTVADVLHANLQERQAAERMYRSKILQLVQRLMTTQLQILKEELRPRIARAISTVSTVSSALLES